MGGGTATSNEVRFSGSMSVGSGGTAISNTVSSGAIINVLSGGTAVSTTLYGGGLRIVGGGKAVSATVSDAFIAVSSGGVLEKGVFNSGAVIHVSSGGTARQVSVNDAGTLYVERGASASDAAVNGGIMCLRAGKANATVVNTGRLFVSKGAAAGNTSVGEGGFLLIYDGGSHTGRVQLETGAQASVYEGGVLDFTVAALAPGNDEAPVNDWSRVKCYGDCTITVSATQKKGTYRLAGGAAAFDETVTVKNTAGVSLGVLTVGAAETFGIGYCLLSRFADVLCFTISDAADTRKPVKPTTTSDSVSGANAMLSWSDATDNVGVAGYQVRYATNDKLTGSTVKSTTDTTLVVNGLKNGTWYWQVRAADAAGNWSPWTSPDSFVIAADTQKPNKPTFTSNSVSGTTAALTWSGASDNIGVIGYEIRYAANDKLAGATVKSTTTTSYTLTAMPVGMWFWQVRARDAAGNWSPWTSPDCFLIGSADTQKPNKPTVTNDSVSGTTAKLTWSGATDNVGVVGYEVRYATNDKLTGATVMSTTATSLSVSGLNNGTWYWQVRAKDATGNWSPWTSPDSFLIGSADTQKPNKPTVTNDSVSGTTAKLTWSGATDNVGVTGYEMRYATNNKLTGATVKSTTATNYTLTGMLEGTWYWQVRAKDAAGNWSPWTSPDSFTVDTQLPTVPKNLAVAGSTGDTKFTWTASTDNVGVANYEVRYATNNKMTGATVKSSTGTTLSVTGLSAGTWYGQVRAKDAANNYSAWTPVVTFAVAASESELCFEDAVACCADLIGDCTLETLTGCGDFTRKFAGLLA